ncbi:MULTISPECIES: carbohydrate kinase [Citrobacter]|uniref:glycine-rich domain-containing protein n=1 Tax=Citrobacter sp. C1 TaxID=2769343 RepID=UPI0013DD8A10|nr:MULTISPECIES: carbohydrate kinase [Citrobacter]
MYFVDNGSAVPVMPQVKPVSSATPQFFTEGGNGTPPTYPGPDWFNIFQLELLNVLKEAQINPDKANHTQLVTAMKKLFLDASSNGSDIPDKAAFLSNLGLVGGLASDAVGRLIGVKIITASTSYIATPGTKWLRVTITGSGGGGGGCQASSNNETFFGAGGGAGGTVIITPVLVNNIIPVTIGAGGAGGVGSKSGLNGGDSSFGSVIAPGGEGGGKSGVTNTNGGNGGVPSTGNIKIIGGCGSDGQSGNIGVSGEGGASYWGGGGRAGAGGGLSGKAYGSGGGGAYDAGYSGTSMTGGKGANGICIIEEFA